MVVGLFVVWPLWWTNLDATATQEEAAVELPQDFSGLVLTRVTHDSRQ
ncbi:hypothetical protein [Kocuria arenosa]